MPILKNKKLKTLFLEGQMHLYLSVYFQICYGFVGTIFIMKQNTLITNYTDILKLD